VIIGAYNAMPYLTECVDSVLRQSIGTDRLEILTVDDGSTDGTGKELDRYAADHPGLLRVLHQENSGGPAAPRNRGMELARGRYVFFLDADDHLGPEALERLVAAADDNRSDVVLGKAVGIGGRRMAASMFRYNQPKTDVFTSRVYWTLSPMKLFRRSFVEEHGLRFDTTLETGEDQPFSALAYIHASNISVVADYDVLFCRKRDDGGNVTSRVTGAAPRVRIVSTMLSLVGENVPAGRRRDHLLYRHFSIELHRALVLLAAPGQEPAEQRRLFTELHESLTRWHSERAMRKLPSFLRLEYHLVHRGELDALLTVMRYLRTELAAQGRHKLPTGHGLPPRDVLHEKGRIYARYPFFRDPALGIPDRVFDVTKELRKTQASGGAVAPSSLVGLEAVETSWAAGRPGVLCIEGRLSGLAERGTLTGSATDPAGTHVRRSAQPTDADGGFRIEIPLRGTGDWRIALRLTGDGGVQAETAVPAAAAPPVGRWYRNLRPEYGKALTEGDTRTVRVDRVRLLRGVARRLGK
jgi:CDP-glycerol glycerophosphotransferase